MYASSLLLVTLFLSTPSARRATPKILVAPFTTWNFYPRPPRGGRRAGCSVIDGRYELFLSTPSARRATRFSLCFLISTSNFYPRPPRGGRLRRCSMDILLENFYPRPPRGGRPCGSGHLPRYHGISIHALREEGDVSRYTAGRSLSYFYPRPPRGGRRDTGAIDGVWDLFLSTPSARRATNLSARQSGGARNFYPRPPRGGRHASRIVQWAIYLISIHALREEGDRKAVGVVPRDWYFYPRPPRGGRQLQQLRRRQQQDFYPRPPRGGRPAVYNAMLMACKFLSTPSARRATVEGDTDEDALIHFYPRPPRGGRHRPSGGCIRRDTYFYPRPPRGGRRRCVQRS